MQGEPANITHQAAEEAADGQEARRGKAPTGTIGMRRPSGGGNTGYDPGELAVSGTMAEIINLRQARKRVAKAKKEGRAEENRALHSLPARQRKATAARNERDKARHEAHRREQPDGNQPGDGD